MKREKEIITRTVKIEVEIEKIYLDEEEVKIAIIDYCKGKIVDLSSAISSINPRIDWRNEEFLGFEIETSALVESTGPRRKDPCPQCGEIDCDPEGVGHYRG